MDLRHRVIDLEDSLAKNGELGIKVAELEDKIVKLNDLKLGDKLAQWEEKARKQ